MRNRQVLWLALLIAGQHLFFLFYFTPILEPDSNYYVTLGRGLAAGLGFDSAVRPPGYPAFLAVFYKLFGPGQFPVILVQHLLGLAVCFSFLAILPGRRQRNVFAALFFCDILYASYQSAVLPETLFSFLLCMSALAFRKYRAAFETRYAFACGALLAAGIFTKPVLKLFPYAALFFFLAEPRPWKKKLSAAAVFLALPLLLPNAWSLKNYLDKGYFSLMPFESYHYVGRVVNHMEFPENSVSKEVFLKNIGPAHLSRKERHGIAQRTTETLKAAGRTETELDKEFKIIVKFSILRHPFIYFKETSIEMFYFFFSAHNLYAKYTLGGKMPFSVTEGLERGEIGPTLLKIAVSMHPFYWLIFLLTAFLAATRWRWLLAGGDMFLAYALALTAYISVITSMANEGLAIYRCPIQPFMLFCSAIVIAAALGKETENLP